MSLRYVQIAYVVFLTLLLWFPDPRQLLWGLQAGESTEGYAHVLTFSLLGFLVEIGRRKKSVFFWATMLILYTFTTEIVQHFLPVRSFDVADILQDFAGIFIGFWGATAARFLLPASLHNPKNGDMMGGRNRENAITKHRRTDHEKKYTERKRTKRRRKTL